MLDYTHHYTWPHIFKCSCLFSQFNLQIALGKCGSAIPLCWAWHLVAPKFTWPLPWGEFGTQDRPEDSCSTVWVVYGCFSCCLCNGHPSPICRVPSMCTLGYHLQTFSSLPLRARQAAALLWDANTHVIRSPDQRQHPTACLSMDPLCRRKPVRVRIQGDREGWRGSAQRYLSLGEAFGRWC